MIHVRVAGADRQLMERAAAAAGKSLSDRIREKLVAAAKRAAEAALPPDNALVFEP